ncbi:diguanylate cyclase [Deinococcus sp. Arct2-2]|uniref:GGDEF domain-containing response regulator n=1 Tax=Deinococcus sp. Arct2-2 TaxID=2568653 RepID=UPI0010A3FCF5|nr:diguanylate cyclase [Deinococcus sp. Arct2-2]THF68988.1 diguanylate cyclase [Deinococcus sp. Arct2-2]
MARLRTTAPSSGYTVLVVDDDDDLRITLCRLLEVDGHEVLSAASGEEALRLCRGQDVHLILLDYFMPGMTGQEVVKHVRTFDPQVQIVLQTGYASEKPPRQMLRELDIQGYHDKSEGPDKLLVWVDAALKTFQHVRALHASRSGLEYILKAAPELHRLQPLDDLLLGILLQIQGLLGFPSAVLATLTPERAALAPSGAVLTTELQEFTLRIGTGRFNHTEWAVLTPAEQTLICTAVKSGQAYLGPQIILPLKAGERTLGVVMVDNPGPGNGDLHLLEIFAAQAAVAIENTRLYSLATIDDLTGLVNKRAWLMRLEETIQLAARHAVPTSVLLLDLDHFKAVNDTYGHLAGDHVLATLGGCVQQHLRRSDVAGRYGGEELAVLLPHTPAAGALIIAERLRGAIERLPLRWKGHALSLTVSIGVASLPSTAVHAPEELAVDVFARADQALYEAKRQGRNRAVQDTEGAPAL